MKRASSILIVLALACKGESVAPLLPMKTISPDLNASTGSFNQMAVAGCTIAVYDHPNTKIHVFEGGLLITSFGESGAGPGQIRHLKSLELAADGSIVAIDWKRHRLLWWNSDGSLRYDRGLDHGPVHHALIGRTLASDDGSYLDFPLAGATFGYALTPADTDTLPLVYGISPKDSVIATWGSLDPPSSSNSLLLRGMLQIGDIQQRNDSLYVLRSVKPRVDVYSKAHPSRTPARTIRMQTWINHGQSLEQLGKVTKHGTVEGGAVSLNEDAQGTLAIDAAGRFYLVMLGPPIKGSTREVGEGWWPKEQLWVYGPDGILVDRRSLQQRGTRRISVAEDGSIVALARPSGSEDDDWSILVYEPLFSDAGRNGRCTWDN